MSDAGSGMSLFWCGLLHEGGDLLARGCAHCTKVLPTWSTPNPPAVAPDPRAVHAQGLHGDSGRPAPPRSRRTTPTPRQLTPLESQREEESGLAQQDPAHAVLGVLGQDQGGPSQEGRQIRTGEEWVLVGFKQGWMPLFLTCKPHCVCIV